MCGVTTECCLTTTAREANDRGFEVCVLQDCTDGYVKDFWEPSINMLSFSDGLFGFTALSTDLRDGLLPLVKKEEKEEKKKWDGKLGIAYLTGLYAEGSLTPDEVIKEVYRRLALASADSAVWLAKVKEEDALKEAKRLEKEFKDPSNRPPLYGIPFSVYVYRNSYSLVLLIDVHPQERLYRRSRHANNGRLSSLRLHSHSKRTHRVYPPLPRRDPDR
jgi:hypothetical protein